MRRTFPHQALFAHAVGDGMAIPHSESIDQKPKLAGKILNFDRRSDVQLIETLNLPYALPFHSH